MSLRNQILCILVALGLLASGRFAVDVVNAWSVERQTASAVAVHQRADTLLTAGFALAMERGLSLGVLANPGPGSAGNWQTAQTRRHEGEAAIDAALTGIAAQPTLAAAPGVEQAIARLQSARAATVALRIRADAAVGVAQPAGALGGELYNAIVAQIDAVAGLRRTIEGSRLGEAEGIAPLMGLRDALAEAAEYTGRQRGLLNGVISRGTPITLAEARELASRQGWVESALGRMDVLAARVDRPEVGAAVSRAQQALRDDFIPLRNRIIAASDQAAAYPIGAPQWFAAATAAIETLNTAQNLCTEAILRMGEGHIAAAEWTITLASSALFGVMGLVALMIWQISRAVLRPLTGIIGNVTAMGQGNLQTPVSGQDRGHEIGDLARAVEGFRQAMQRAEADRAAFTEAERAAIAAQEDALRAMANLVEGETRQGIAMMAKQMELVVLGSADLSSAADRTQLESRNGAEAADEALASAQSVASATEQLGASIGEITARLAEASRSTRIAAELGHNGRTMIEALSEAVGRIGGVARLIGNIAGQTNLLALNATIEAARSGEAGKGFAVVAGEVKALAAQTAKATEEISREIGAVMQSTERAVGVVREMADAVASVDQVTTAIAAAMEEQSAATREIASAVARAAAASGRVSEGMAEVTEAAQESSREADSMRQGSVIAQTAIEEVRKTIIRVVREGVAVADRRSSPRRDIPCDAQILLDGSQQRIPAQLRDISEGGFGLTRCDRELVSGERMILRADSLLPGIELPAEVLAVHPDGSVNCRFLALRADVVAALATLVQAGRVGRAA